MVEIQSGARYFLTNSLLGSTNALASTSANDTVIVGPTTSDGSQSWYFLETSTSGYFRLHTEQKGDYAALDVFNYNGKNTIDLHMYSVQENTGQHWHLNKQEDGSVKINNLFTGSDIYLDVVKDTLQPTLAAKDGPGQRWTLSQLGSSPTSTSSITSSVISSVTGEVTTASVATENHTSSATATMNASSSGGISKGAVGGIIAAAVVVVAALAIGAFILRRKKRNNGSMIPDPPTIGGRAMLHVSPTRHG